MYAPVYIALLAASTSFLLASGQTTECQPDGPKSPYQLHAHCTTTQLCKDMSVNGDCCPDCGPTPVFGAYEKNTFLEAGKVYYREGDKSLKVYTTLQDASGQSEQWLTRALRSRVKHSLNKAQSAYPEYKATFFDWTKHGHLLTPFPSV